jgi:hypothetical protein
MAKKSFAESFKVPVELFMIASSHFINGANGNYDEWFVPLEETDLNPIRLNGSILSNGSNPEAKHKVFTEVNHKKIWEKFENFILELKVFKEALADFKSSDTKSESSSFFKECLKKGNLIYTVAFSYSILSLLQMIIGEEANGKHVVNLAFEHWDFGRKLKDIYCSFGVSEHEAKQITDVVKAVLKRNKSKDMESLKWDIDNTAIAAQIININYNEEDFRNILGINLYDDIVWYNKEGFETALFYTSLLISIDSSLCKSQDKLNRIADIYELLKNADKKSEFRFDFLIDILTSKPKSVGKKSRPSLK